MTPPLLNGALVASVRLLIPCIGAWVAEVALDVPASGDLPTGPAVLAVGGVELRGTVDDRATGRKGTRARIHILAGGGGWGRVVPARHLHNDFGVTTTAVFQTTAAAVGETVVDGAPRVLGPDFVRTSGPASRVLAGVPWYVDAAGITRTVPRASEPLSSAATVLDWDPSLRRATIASGAIVWPGMAIADSRFGRAVIRDVEHTFDSTGARAIAWCESAPLTLDEPAGTKLARALAYHARESVGPAYLRRHRYRVVLQGVDGRLTLQAIAPSGAVPDLLEAIEVWPGVAGVSVKLALGSVVLVAFVARDAPFSPLPIVVGFDPQNPAPLELDVPSKLVVGGAGSAPVVIASDDFTAWVAAVSTATGAPAPAVYQATKLEAK